MKKITFSEVKKKGTLAFTTVDHVFQSWSLILLIFFPNTLLCGRVFQVVKVRT